MVKFCDKIIQILHNLYLEECDRNTHTIEQEDTDDENNKTIFLVMHNYLKHWNLDFFLLFHTYIHIDKNIFRQ